MQQTILALLALMIATLFSYNQERSMLHMRETMIDTEMEVMASGVALQVMEYIGRKAFDDQTTDGERVATAAELTSASGFGVSGKCDVVAPIQTVSPYSDCDDLDDYDHMALERVPFVLKTDTVYFDVTAEVKYVESDGSESFSPTFDKQVTVYVRNDGDKQYMQAPVMLSRTFSYERMRGSN